MKFQCERCKTRYSIADERVRGKILKIRCKNCEAVITVREGMDAAAPPVPKPAAARPRRPSAAVPSPADKPVLRGAFDKAMGEGARPPSRGFDDEDQTVISDDPPPAEAGTGGSRAGPLPDHLSEEWYVSRDGEQFGPFDLDQAKSWVAARPPGEELFCWTEGFDDWQRCDKVSHFRRSRARTSVPPPPPGPSPATQPRRDETPKPLFAATLAAIEREEGSQAGADDLPPPSNGASAGAADDLNFDIGEASRVVDLSVLQNEAARRGRQSRDSGGGLPGMDTESAESGAFGKGTGGFAQVRELGKDGRKSGRSPVVVPLSDQALASAQPEVLQSPARRGGGVQLWHVLAALGAVAAVAVVMLIVALSSDSSADDSRIVRSRVEGEGLGYRLDPRERKSATGEVDGADDRDSKRRGGNRVRDPRPRATNTANARTAFDPFKKTDDFDFGDDADDSNKPLTPDDVMAVYQDRKLGVKLCYERALKKDPLLDVKKVYVNLSVAPSGVVTNVSMSSHADTPLGQCLVSQIRRWRFRKSPETFTGRFPLVFRN